MHLFLAYSPLDFSFVMTPISVWNYIEIVGGIVCACLPVSKPVVFWATGKMGLTGERGYIAWLKTHRSDDGTGARSAGGDIEVGPSPLDGSRLGSLPGRKLSDPSGRTDREFTKYLGSGDAALLHP